MAAFNFCEELNGNTFHGERDVVVTHSFQLVFPKNLAGGQIKAEQVTVRAGENKFLAEQNRNIGATGSAEQTRQQLRAPECLTGDDGNVRYVAVAAGDE